MFTPPPSPDPRRPQPSSRPKRSSQQLRSLDPDYCTGPLLSPSPASSQSSSCDLEPLRLGYETRLTSTDEPSSYAFLEKKRIGRRIRWTVVFVPLILIFVALSTRYLTHPAAFDVLSPSRSSPWSTVQDWTPHKRHAAPDPLPATSSGIATTVQNSKPTGSALSVAASASGSAAPSMTTAVNPGNTKVPSSPPVLPTPFPQAFDSTFSTNFQTVACQSFMTNMTQTFAFRECRPFSLLVGDSNAFINVSLFDLRTTLLRSRGTRQGPLHINVPVPSAGRAPPTYPVSFPRLEFGP